jgi:hemerythrin-like domain-containing protein
MAAKSRRAPQRAQPLAIELLAADHREVESLFERYEQEKEGDEDARKTLAERICGELKVHTQVEEEIFYPWLRDHLEDEDMSLVEEAQVEHNGARDLIEQIEAAGSIDAEYNAKVKVLGEYVKHHVNEEENGIFPKVRDEQEALDELGQEISSRKEELREELGLEAAGDEEAQEEDEDGARGRDARHEPGERARRGG